MSDSFSERRKLLKNTATALAGGACCMMHFSEAEASNTPKEVDLSVIKEGETKTVLWCGKPVFIRHRAKAEVDGVRKTPMSALIDPEKDEDRVRQSVFQGKVMPEWLVTMGACSHLGCVPRAAGKEGAGAWFCTCHGSRFDVSGRVQNGPAQKELASATV